MKKFFYSEELGKYFDTEDECKAQEELFRKNTEKLEIEAKEKENRKKLLADRISKANDILNIAYKEKENAIKQCKEIRAKADKEIDDIMDRATEKIHVAANNKYKAVLEFNKEFGVYKEFIDDSTAIDELNRTLREFYYPFSSIFKFFN